MEQYTAGSKEDTLTGKVQRGNVFAGQCPSRNILNHLTSRWGVLVLIALQSGTQRFSELRRKVGGVSEKMLAQTLQRLVEDGFVLRHDFQEVPPHVEYALTPLGEEAAQHVAALADWIERNIWRICSAGSAGTGGSDSPD